MKNKAHTLKPLTNGEYEILKPFFTNPPYDSCVYTLPSLIVWHSPVFQPYWAVDDDMLIACLEFDARHTDKRHMILPLLRSNEIIDPESLHRTALAFEYERIWFVTDAWLDMWGKPRIEALFDIAPQEYLNDYVYRTRDLAELKGNRYSKKRNLVNQFTRTYVDTNRTRIEPITPASVGECMDFLEEWCKERDCDADPNEDMACEKRAAVHMLNGMERFDVRGLLLRIDGAVNAFGIGAHLNATMGVFHFEKAFAGVKGLYQYFDKMCARELFGDFEFINKESDMSVPGIAKAKKSYYPCRMVESCQLTVR